MPLKEKLSTFFFVYVRGKRMKSTALIKEYKNGRRKFSNIKLINQSFRDENLAGIDLSNSYIRGCDFRGANLHRANFSGATIGLSIAQYIQVIVHGPISDKHRENDFIVSWFETIFSAAFALSRNLFILYFFIGLTFRFIGEISVFLPAFLFSISFILAFLVSENRKLKRHLGSSYGVLFQDSIIKNSNFSNSKIDRAAFLKTDLRNSNFESSNIRNSNFMGSRLDYIIWFRSNLENNFLPINNKVLNLCIQRVGQEEDFTQTKEIKKTNFSKINLYKANFSGVDLTACIFDDSNLESCLLIGCNLRSARFKNTNLKRANLKEADVSLAFFEHVDFRQANLSETKAIGTKFLSGSNLSGVCIANWSINANSQFSDIKCTHVYLDCLYRQDRIKYIQRFPKDKNTYLNYGDFEKVISRFYGVLALVFEYALLDISKSSEYSSLSKDQVARVSKDLEILQKNVESSNLPVPVKRKILSVLETRKEVGTAAYDILNDISNPSSLQVIVNVLGDFMSGNTGSQSFGDTKSQSTVQVSGNASAPIQTTTSGRDSYSTQNFSKTTNSRISDEDAVRLISTILNSIQDAKLPQEISEEIEDYMALVQKEASKKTPNKKRILGNLENVIDLLKNMDVVTGVTQNLISKLKGPVTQLAGWLGSTLPLL